MTGAPLSVVPDRTRFARVRKSAAQQVQRLDFDRVSDPLLIKGAPELVEALSRIVQGWPRAVSVQPEAALTDPVVLASVTAARRGFTAHSRYTDSPLPGLSLAAAACALVADLSVGFVDSDPDLRALHCGAVEVNGKLVILTGAHRAGKSTLIARLTAEPQMRVFCDDVLPILPDGRGVALGIAPRLRLPLPKAASAEFRTHIAQMTVLHDARYAYIRTPTQAPHGATAPLSAVVLLDRRKDRPAGLHYMEPDVALRHVLERNLADLGTAETAFAQMHGLISGLSCLRLVYSDVEEAVALLDMAFGGQAAIRLERPVAEEHVDQPAREPTLVTIDPQTDWQKNPRVVQRQVGQSSFLWMPDDPMLWHLNSMGGAIWALLDVPGSAIDLTDVLTEVFPKHPQSAILSDTLLLLAQLHAKGMILPA